MNGRPALFVRFLVCHQFPLEPNKAILLAVLFPTTPLHPVDCCHYQHLVYRYLIRHKNVTRNIMMLLLHVKSYYQSWNHCALVTVVISIVSLPFLRQRLLVYWSCSALLPNCCQYIWIQEADQIQDISRKSTTWLPTPHRKSK